MGQFSGQSSFHWILVLWTLVSPHFINQFQNLVAYHGQSPSRNCDTVPEVGGYVPKIVYPQFLWERTQVAVPSLVSLNVSSYVCPC